MRKSIKKTGVLIICAVLLASGCKKNDDKQIFTNNKTKQPSYQPLLDMISPSAYRSVSGLSVPAGSYISIIGKNSDSEYWKTVEKGVNQAGEDLNNALGYEGSDRVKVSYNAPESGENVDEQVNILDEEMDRNPNALGIASIDESASAVQFDIATQNQIPLIALDSGNVYQGIQSICKTNNEKAAREAADRMADLTDGAGKILIVAHDHISQTAKDRESGFKDELKEKYPDMESEEVIYMDQLSDEKEKIGEQTGREADEISDEEVLLFYMKKEDGIRGIFGTNANCVRYILDALDQREDTAVSGSGQIVSQETAPVVIGFDGGSSMMKSMEDGKVQGLIMQNPFGIGYASVIASCRAVLGVGNEAVVDTGYAWVTKDNMEDPLIKVMMY